MKVRRVTEWDVKDKKSLTYVLIKVVKLPEHKRRLRKLGKVLINDIESAIGKDKKIITRTDYFELIK